MTQFEFYKSFQFVFELLIAEMLFVNRFRRRRYFALRLPAAIVVCFLGAWAVPSLSDNPFYVSFVFLFIFMLTLLMTKFVFEESWLTVAFCCIAGYTTQHMAYEIYNLLLLAFGFPPESGFYGTGAFAGIFPNLFAVVLYIFSYGPSYLVCWLLFATQLRERESIKLKSGFFFALAVSVLAVDIILNAVVVRTEAEADTLKIIIGIYNILCCFFSMFLQFGASVQKKLEDTLGSVELMWHQASKQYKISKENIELINLKCHDLKHRIHKLRSGGADADELGDIEEQIAIYDSTVKTGNDALDVILTEKSLTCGRNGIVIDIIADGEKLDFMAKEDIYSLFGNIMDNAIASVLGLEREERNISLSIRTSGEMLVIRESNRYGSPITFEDGLPVSPGDRRFHGFGMKSIKYVCDRYEADLAVSAENGVFTINILFPNMKALKRVPAPGEEREDA